MGKNERESEDEKKSEMLPDLLVVSGHFSCPPFPFVHRSRSEMQSFLPHKIGRAYGRPFFFCIKRDAGEDFLGTKFSKFQCD